MWKLIFFFGMGAVVAQLAFSGNTDYAKLRSACKQKPNEGCCLASVRTMKKNRYEVVVGSSCPAGFSMNMYRCPGSYQWCEPK